MKINKGTPQEIMIDYWHSQKHHPGKYRVDASFYPQGSFGYSYRGNIYDDSGKCIGDYGTNDSLEIEKNFKFKFE